MAGIKISKDGYFKLQDELKKLESERPIIQRAVAEARAHGDLKENAEYHASRERQRMLENQINELKIKLATAEVIDIGEVDKSSVRFGAKVTLENLNNGKESIFSIVGDDEADIISGLLSIESPIGRGLLGKKIGDIAEIKIPAGLVKFEIKKIEY